MKELDPDIVFRNVLTIYNNGYTFEYDIDTDKIYLSWLDEEDEEIILLIYDTTWLLDESPFKDLDLLEKYLLLFKEYK